MPVQPPPGFSAIPNSRHGGFHKQTAGGWVQWYPDGKTAQGASEDHASEAKGHPEGSPERALSNAHAERAGAEAKRHATGEDHPHAAGDPAEGGKPGQEGAPPGAPGQEGGAEQQPGQPPKHKHNTPYIDPANVQGDIEQSHTEKEKLFAEVAGAHAAQVKMLNEGTGLDAAIGATVVRGDQDYDWKNLAKDMEGDKPLIIIGPTKNATEKGRARCQEKVDADYDGDWSQLTDLVRATVAVNSFDDINGLMTQLQDMGMEFGKVTDRFQSFPKQGQYKASGPTPAGYRDINMKVRYQGHVSELQIHVKPILRIKDEAHDHYEKIRSIESKLKTEGRMEMTPEEEDAYTTANEKSMELYGQAWAEAIQGTPMEAMAKGGDDDDAKKVDYFEYEGQPAYKVAGQVPIRVGKKGPKPIYDLQKFAHHAGPMEKDEFDQMVSAMKGDESDMEKAIRILGTEYMEIMGLDIEPITGE